VVKFGDKPCAWCKHLAVGGNPPRCGMTGAMLSAQELSVGCACPNWKLRTKKKVT